MNGKYHMITARALCAKTLDSLENEKKQKQKQMLDNQMTNEIPDHGTKGIFVLSLHVSNPLLKSIGGKQYQTAILYPSNLNHLTYRIPVLKPYRLPLTFYRDSAF